MLLTLLSMSSGWDVSQDRLKAWSEDATLHSIKRITAELQKQGYLEIEQIRDTKGRIVESIWHVNEIKDQSAENQSSSPEAGFQLVGDTPKTESGLPEARFQPVGIYPEVELPHVVKPSAGNSTPYKRTLYKKTLSNKEAYKSDFLSWWNEYPKKVDRLNAERAYLKARGEVSAEVLLEGLRRYKANKPGYAEWKGPAAWLNAKRWEDEYTTEPQAEIPKQEKWVDKLMAAQAIFNRFNPEYIIPVEEITRDKFDQLWHQNKRLVESEFDPVGAA